MRILQVIHGFLPQFRGGTELHVLGLARELRDLGHEVEIVSGTTHSAPEACLDRYVHDGFPVHKIVLSGTYLEHWTRSLSPHATRLFTEVLRAVRPDVVHVHHWYRLSRDLIETCHRRGVPAVCTLHDLWTSCPRLFRIREETFCERPVGAASCLDCVPRFPWAGDAETAAEVDLFRDDFVNELRLARRVIVPSRAHGDLVRRMTELPDDTLIVIPHGSIVELQSDAPADLAPEASDGRIRLGVWGHLFHMKGVHLVLEALREDDLADAFELHVWGRVVEPRYKERLEESARGLDVTWHGSFTPEDLRAVPLDLAVIPTICSESFSFVLDEAFDMGMPALVPDRGALPERLGGAGGVFEPESSASLAELLRGVADDASVLEDWRHAIPDLTSLTWHAREVANVYNQVLAEEPEFREQPDAALPARRLEVLSDTRVAQERSMFAYLGHIKRETGRADHYQKTTEAAIARQHELGAEMADLRREQDHERAALQRERDDELAALRRERDDELAASRRERDDEVAALRRKLDEVREESRDAARRARADETLAREILDFRRIVSDVDAERPAVERGRDEVPAVDVPELGPLRDVVADDTRIMERFAARIAERNAVLALVGREIVAFREVIAAVGSGEESVRGPVAVPDTDVDVPDLGPPAAIVADDDAILAGFVAGEAGRRAAAADREAALLHEMDNLRQALVRASEVLGAIPEAGDDELARIPAGVSIERLVDMNREVLEAWYERIGELRGLRDEVGTLQVSLAAKAVLIERLGGFVEELRAVLVGLHADTPRLPELEEIAECPDEHVPGLGDLRTVHDVNLDIVRAAVRHVSELKAALRAHAEAAAADPPESNDQD